MTFLDVNLLCFEKMHIELCSYREGSKNCRWLPVTSVVLKFSDKYIRSGRRQRGVHFSCVGTNMQFTSRFFCPDDAAFEKCCPKIVQIEEDIWCAWK